VFAGLIKRANQGDASSARLILEAIGKLKVQGTKEEKNLTINITPESRQEYEKYKQVMELVGDKTIDEIRSLLSA
jgi:hypothetical protein